VHPGAGSPSASPRFGSGTRARLRFASLRLEAYRVALQFLTAVKAAQITDRKLEDEALRAAKSTCLNPAEGAARVTRADTARAYAVARGETHS
jgi:hypothetical protein